MSSVRDKGVTQPAIVRPREDGGYEIVSGHRRQKASELAGFVDMPCIVRDLTDEQAITQMVEDNTNQRENILPSERAKALKMQLEAIKHQGAKEATSGQLDPKDAGRRSNEIVAERNFKNGRLIILVDEYSASASEIVTGAIQDWDRGVVVLRHMERRILHIQLGKIGEDQLADYAARRGMSIEETKKFLAANL